MGYAEKRGDYWRGRYKIATGKYGTVVDDAGVTLRFRTRPETEQAANDAEAKLRNGGRRDPSAGRESFGSYASRWYAEQGRCRRGTPMSPRRCVSGSSTI